MPSMWDGIEPEGNDDYAEWGDVEPAYQNTPTVVQTYAPSSWERIGADVEPLGQQTVLRQGEPDQPNLIERGVGFVQDLLGIEDRPELGKRITPRERAADVVNITGGPSESAPRLGAITQLSSNYMVGAFPGFASLYEAVEGERFLEEPDTVIEELAAGAGRFAGMITGLPGKASHSAMAAITKKFPNIRAFANQPFFGRVLKSVLNEGATVGTLTAMGSIDDALNQTDVESAAKVVLNGFKEGAKLGAVFGLARGVFPNQTILSRMARIASGLVGIEALHSGQGEGLHKEGKIMEWVHRFMDVYFLWKGLGKDYGTKALEELENTKSTPKRYDMLKEVELFNYKKEHNRLPPKAQVASARDMLNQIEEMNQRRADLEQGFSPWSPELAHALDSEPLLLPAGQGFEFSDVPPRQLAEMLDTGRLMLPEPPAERMGEMTAGEYPGQIVEASRWSPELATSLKTLALPDAPHSDITRAREQVEWVLNRMSDASGRMKEYAEAQHEGAARDAILKRVKEYDKKIEELGGQLADLELQRQSRDFTMRDADVKTRKGSPEGQAVRDRDVPMPEVEIKGEGPRKEPPGETVVDTTKAEEPTKVSEKDLGDFLADQAGMKYVGKAKGVHVFKKGRRTFKVKELTAQAIDELRLGGKKAEPKKEEPKAEPKPEKKPKRKVGEKKVEPAPKPERKAKEEKAEKPKPEPKPKAEKEKPKEEEAPKLEKAEPEEYEIAAGTKKFVDRKVKSLGSVKAVDEVYTTKDAISKYARAKARELFPEKGEVPKQEKPEVQEKPEEEKPVKLGKRNVGDMVLTPDGIGQITRVGRDRKNKDLREDQYEVDIAGEKEVYGKKELDDMLKKEQKKEEKPKEKRKVGDKKPTKAEREELEEEVAEPKRKRLERQEKPKRRITRDDKLAARNAEKDGLEYLGRDDGGLFVFRDKAKNHTFKTDAPYTVDIRDTREATRPKTESEKLEEKVGKKEDVLTEQVSKKLTEEKVEKDTSGLDPEARIRAIEDEMDAFRQKYGANPDNYDAATRGAMKALQDKYLKVAMEAQKESEAPLAQAKEKKVREPDEVEIARYTTQKAWRAAEDIAISKGMAARTRSGNVYPKKGYTMKEITEFVARTRDKIIEEQEGAPKTKKSDAVGKRAEFNYPLNAKYEHLEGQQGQGEVIKETKQSYVIKSDDGMEVTIRKKNVTLDPEGRKGGIQKMKEMDDMQLAAEGERLSKLVEAGEPVDADYAMAVGKEIMRRAQEQDSKKRAKKDAIMETRAEELAQKNAAKRFGKKTKESIGDATLSFMGTGAVGPTLRRTYGQLKRTFVKLNGARKALLDAYRDDPLPANYFNSKKDMIMKKNRMVEYEVQFELDTLSTIRKLAKDKKDAKMLGDAMSLWIEYRTKPEIIEKYWDSLDEYTQATVRRMWDMTEAEQDLARTLEMHIKENGIIGEHGGVLTMLKDNPLSGFISHIWESPTVQGEHNVKPFWNAPGRLSPKTGFGKERTFTEGFLEGIANGYRPATLNVAELTRAYGESVWKAVTNKRFIEDLKNMSINTDNRPALVGLHEKGFEDYVAIDNYWLTKKKFTALKDLSETLSTKTYTGEELSRFLMEFVPVKAHPDIARDINNYLEPSWFTKSSKRMLAKKLNYIAKKTLLSFTGFHHVAIGKTALFYMNAPRVVDALVRPWKISKEGLELISRQDADINFLIENGMTLSGGSAMDYGRQLTESIRDWDQYMRESGALGKVRGTVGKYSKWWDSALWDKYYRGSKALAGKIEYNRRLKRFSKELAEGTISRQEIARRVARDMNNNFGGLNLEFGTGWMGETHGRSRSKTAQDMTRFLLLAQDWTESNYKFFWQASAGSLLKHGIPFKKGFNLKEGVFGDSTYYMAKVLFFTGLATQLINHAINGHLADDNIKGDKWNPNNHRVKVPIDGKNYYIDLFGHFMEPVKLVTESIKEGGDPLQKLAHKSSIPGRIVLEQFTGRDWAGRHFATWQDWQEGRRSGTYYGKKPGLKESIPGRAVDIGRKFIPIPINALVGLALDDKTYLEAITTAVGVPMRERKRRKKDRRRRRRVVERRRIVR